MFKLSLNKRLLNTPRPKFNDFCSYITQHHTAEHLTDGSYVTNTLYIKIAVSCTVYNAEKGPPTIFAKVEVCEFQARFFVLNVCRTGLKT